MALAEDTRQLNEVQVTGKIPAGEQKGDTVPFHAGAFKTAPRRHAGKPLRPSGPPPLKTGAVGERAAAMMRACSWKNGLDRRFTQREQITSISRWSELAARSVLW